jgi:UDP-4-amino-4,6-dideoxy-N-acetyl-beta-L-altrosamine transaminase
MSFIPYSCQQISDDDVAAVVAALRSEYLTQGPAVPRFEEAFAYRHGVSHAIAVSSATAGLHIACLALGVGRGDLVWTSPISFVASANCARYCGADIDFVDIDPTTRNMSVRALRAKLESAVANGRMPKVVVPVDFAGVPADLREIRELADRHGFSILQDASHATGASYLRAPIGSRFADVSVFSFHAVKVVTTAEGGMCTTQDPVLASRLRQLRSHGITRDAAEMREAPEGAWVYEQQSLGFNYRMTDLQAALGLSQLARLEEFRRGRQARVDRYDALLGTLPVRRPRSTFPDRESAWHLYVVEVDFERAPRARVFDSLRAAGIGVNVHYIPIHLQPYYRDLGFRPGLFPAAEAYYKGALTLPLFPSMTDRQQDQVVVALKSCLA